MMTQRDPYVNMLRTTIAVTAAGLGGADNIAALPHTAALGLPDAFARRVARNTQLILLEESNLAKVADPAAGSGAIEDSDGQALRRRLGAVPGDRRSGRRLGMRSKAVCSRAKSRRCAQQRQANAARRKDALTGTSDYPNLAELPAAVLDVAPLVPPKEAAAAADVRAAAEHPPGRAVRGAARCIRPRAEKNRRAAESVPGQSRQAVGLHRARDVRQEFLRGRRHRGARAMTASRIRPR